MRFLLVLALIGGPAMFVTWSAGLFYHNKTAFWVGIIGMFVMPILAGIISYFVMEGEGFTFFPETGDATTS